jgi:hypothetical protein
MKALLTFIRHNQSVVVSVILCIVIVVWGMGCQPTTRSPINRNEKVTRPELDAEVKALAEKVSLAYEDLEKQEEVRKTILEAGMILAQGETVNFFGVVTTLAGILGVGAIVDNRRKDSVIKAKDNALSNVLGANGKPIQS